MRERLYASLVGKLLSPVFGTFWWMREKLLIELLRREDVEYDYESERVEHPHVSLLDRGICEGRGAVPFLFGTSGGNPHCHVKVAGLRQSEPDHLTYFGTLVRPVFLDYRTMLSKSDDTDPDQLIGKNWERSNIWPNWDRMEMTDDERKCLRDWCQRWDLL